MNPEDHRHQLRLTSTSIGGGFYHFHPIVSSLPPADSHDLLSFTGTSLVLLKPPQPKRHRQQRSRRLQSAARSTHAVFDTTACPSRLLTA